LLSSYAGPDDPDYLEQGQHGNQLLHVAVMNVAVVNVAVVNVAVVNVLLCFLCRA
jgi:hypothetical protein